MSRESLGAFVRRIRKEKNLSCADVSKQSARFENASLEAMSIGLRTTGH
jgi:hypothetical protein